MSSLIRNKCSGNTTVSTARILLKLRSFASSTDGPSSDYPPEPIPDRPLRRKSAPFQKHTASRFNGSRENESSSSSRGTTDADFLDRFKLGFDRKPDGPKPGSDNNVSKLINAEKVEPLSPPQDADDIFKKMKETGLIPNAVAMLDGLCKDGLVQDAMKLFGLMREKGSIPEVVVYTAVVDGFCKAHKFDDAVRIFKKMQGNGVVPNAFSYGVLVGGLCRGKRIEEGFGFCIEMLEAGHAPNLATFIGLVDGYCQEKGLEEAQQVVGSLRDKGFHIEEKTVREYLDKKGPFLPSVWEAILGKKASKTSFF